MFSHIMVGSNDLDASRKFYDATLGALGARAAGPGDRLVYMHGGGLFLVTKPINGEPACHANGGTPIEADPGVREGAFGKLYLAYLRDPSGNKVCAMHRIPA